MPNIVMVGYFPQKERGIVPTIEFAQEVGKAVQSFLESVPGSKTVVTFTMGQAEYCIDPVTREDAPYFIVRDTDVSRAEGIAGFLFGRYNFDIEVQIIDLFIPKRVV